MSAIKKYQELKGAIRDAENWGSLVNKRYAGGGGFGKITGTHVKLDIYYQGHDGAKNYHGIPNEQLQRALNEVVNTNIHYHIAQALDKMRKQLGELAQAAADEADEILKDTELAKA